MFTAISFGSGDDNMRGVAASLSNSTLHIMLYTLAVILVVAWLLGLVTSYTLGGFIHLLLLLAVVVVLVRLIRGESPVV